jgi:hypothetical protein
MRELEKNCINYTKGKCIIEKLTENYLSCENCFYRQILKEGEETTVTETYTLKRINGNLVKVLKDNEEDKNEIYIEI